MPSSKDIEQENLKTLSSNKVLTSIKGHNPVKNEQKITVNNPNIEIVNINAYTKFGEILSICSPDIECKRKSDIDQGHNSVTNMQKMTANNPNLQVRIQRGDRGSGPPPPLENHKLYGYL